MFSRAIIYTALKIISRRHSSISVTIGPDVEASRAAVLESLAHPTPEQAEPIEQAAARFLSAVITDQVRNSHCAHYGRDRGPNIQSVIGIHEGTDDIFYCKASHYVMERRAIKLSKHEFIDACRPRIRQGVSQSFVFDSSFDELTVSINIDSANAFQTKQKGFDYMPSVRFESSLKGERLTDSPIGHREQSKVVASILNAIGLSLFTPNSKGFLYNGAAKFMQNCMLHVTFRKGLEPDFYADLIDSFDDDVAFVLLEGDSKTPCDQGVPAVTGLHIEEFLDALENASGESIRPLSNRRTKPACRSLLGHLVNIHTEPKGEWDDMLDESLGKTRDVDELISRLRPAIDALQRSSIYQAIRHPDGAGWF